MFDLHTYLIAEANYCFFHLALFLLSFVGVFVMVLDILLCEFLGNGYIRQKNCTCSASLIQGTMCVWRT